MRLPHLLLLFALLFACAESRGQAAKAVSTDLPATSKRADATSSVVFLLHGLGKGPLDMTPMEMTLLHHGWEVVNWRYNSTQKTIDELATDLAAALVPYADRRVDFVGHSMGGIVVRTYLQRYHPTNAGRLVMIGSPNHGATIAGMLGDFMAFRLMLGPAGQQLRRDSRFLAELGPPTCEFGIIAGGKGDGVGILKLLPGDNDGIVEVESTRLPGAADFVLVPYVHASLPMMPRVVRETEYFLRTGKFAHDARRAAEAARVPKVRRALPLEP